MADEEALSHEEVWDDSALIDSWNQALDEYKKYHSILAKGGSIKDLENAVNSSSKQVASDGEKADEEEPAAEPEHPMQDPIPSRNESSDGLAPPGPPPQALLGSIKDESLKKLLMAWYYAGYYTGLFEGQQQADHK